MIVHGYEIVRAEIPKYLTVKAFGAINLWKTWKVFGMPFAGGWAEQPAVYMDVIEALEWEARKRQTEGKDGGGK
jgi:hypothetical protein